jgi:hypothetical protein
MVFLTSEIPMRARLLVSVLVALGGGRAQANGCAPARVQVTPIWQGNLQVGRLCTITIDNPDGNEQQDAPTIASDLVIRYRGSALPFKVTGPTRVSGTRYYGCGPGLEGARPYPYLRYVLTPVDPLPAQQAIEVMRGAELLLTFATTDQLDTKNCAAPEHPHGGFCQPPLDFCTPDASPPPSPDAAPPLPPDASASADAGVPDAAPSDAPATAPTTDANTFEPSGSDAAPADAAPAPKTASDGCAIGGRGGFGALWILALAGLATRRQRTSGPPR